MSKELIQFQNIIQLEILHRPSKKIKSPYVADAVNKNGDEFLVHTPGLGLADQCLPGSKIFATPSKSKSSKTDYIAQSVSVNERNYGKTLIGANPHTAELIGKEILTSKNKSYYDTNIKSHHHFYDEGSKELTDIHYSQIKLSKVPVPPKGKKIKNLEVVIRIQK